MLNKNSFTKIDKTIILGFIIYLIVMLIIFLPGYLKKEHENLYILTTRMRIKYEKGTWLSITDPNDYLSKKFNIYEDGKYLGNYQVVLNNSFILYDDDKQVDYSGGILGYRGTLKLDLMNYNFKETKSSEDDFIVKQALKKMDITEDAYYSIDQKVFSDVDNNGNNETIYNISNIKQPDSESIDCVPIPVKNSSNVNFSILFMYKDNNVYIINSIVDDKQEFETFEIQNILDIKADGKKELLYTRGYPLNPSSECSFLYNLAKAKQIKNFCE